MANKCVLIWLLYSYSELASAATGTAIRCEKFYQIFTGCKIANNDFYSSAYAVQLDGSTQEIETTFDFEYRFNCDHRQLPLFWQAGAQHTAILRSEAWKKERVTGLGSLSLFQDDQYQSEARRFHFPAACVVEVRRLELRPSDKTVKEWRRMFIDYTERVADATYTLNKLNDLQLVKSAFQFIEQLAMYFVSELAGDERSQMYQTLRQVKPILETMVEQPEGALNVDEIATLRATLQVVATMPNPALWQDENGQPKKIKDFLADSDREILAHLAERFLNEAEYEQYRLKYYRKLHSWNEQLQTLQNLIDKWGE